MIHEIFQAVAAAPDRAAKIAILRENVSPCLVEILKYAYHPNCKFYTNVVPPFKNDDSPEGLSFSSLYNEYRKFYIYLDQDTEQKVHNTRTDIKRKEIVLIQALESVHPQEALILASLINGSFPKTTGTNKKLVEEAFPGLLK